MTSGVSGELHPQVLWSQRSDTVTLVINLQDVTGETLDLSPSSLEFQGQSGPKKYHFKLDFCKDILVEVGF